MSNKASIVFIDSSGDEDLPTTTSSSSSSRARRRPSATAAAGTGTGNNNDDVIDLTDFTTTATRRRKSKSKSSITTEQQSSSRSIIPSSSNSRRNRQQNRRSNSNVTWKNDDDDEIEIVQQVVNTNYSRSMPAMGSFYMDDNNNKEEEEEDDEVGIIQPPSNYQKRRKRECPIIQLVDNDNRTTTVAPAAPAADLTSVQLSPLERILEVFPDIDHTHATQLLTQAGIGRPDGTTTTAYHPHPSSYYDNPTMITAAVTLLSNNNNNQHHYHDDDGDGATLNNYQEGLISTIIQRIIEEGMKYPKAKKTSTSSTSTSTTSSSQTTSNGKQSNLYDYSSKSITYTQSTQYRNDCHRILTMKFPFLSKNGLNLYLKLSNFRYYLCHDRILNAIKKIPPITTTTTATTTASGGGGGSTTQQETEEELQLRAVQNALAGRKLTSIQQTALCTDNIPTNYIGTIRITLKQPRKISPIHHYNNDITSSSSDIILQDEIQYTNTKYNEWKTNIEQNTKRRKARYISEINGTTLECQCCYLDYASCEMVSCRNEGHLFCMDCLRRHAEERIFGFGDFGKRTSSTSTTDDDDKATTTTMELTCMHMDGCTSPFTYSQLDKALPAKIMSKYDELQASLVMEKAGLDDLLTKCPECNYQAMLPETQMILTCPSCNHESCRNCGGIPHIPLKCEEVVKEKDKTNARLLIEEAMTKARVRVCPKVGCGKKFYKTEGCNKMSCPSCSTFICYVCRSEIPKSIGYKHFCQKPHCRHTKNDNCSGCPLYSNSTEDDMRAAREAGLKTAAEIQEEHGDQNMELDLEKILENPSSM